MRWFVMMPVLALAACVAIAPSPGSGPGPGPLPDDGRPIEPWPEDLCGARSLQGLVGQNRSVLAVMKFAGPVRIIGPDMAVTMDYSAERLNISYDRRDIITTVACG